MVGWDHFSGQTIWILKLLLILSKVDKKLLELVLSKVDENNGRARNGRERLFSSRLFVSQFVYIDKVGHSRVQTLILLKN